MKNLQGKTPQQKREYIQNIDVTNLDSGSRDVIKNIRTAYDYRASQSSYPSVNSAKQKSKDNSGQTQYDGQLKSQTPVYLTLAN